eukprot:gb/GEZN01011224.1/.p1 GENE.gb/GEZN01011224.1/~~gb/GEZN01011224.1/.p1  ORF type:complete len:319 (+),score=0.62 gb/GEZN01011224.1/:54-1010(+)
MLVSSRGGVSMETQRIATDNPQPEITKIQRFVCGGISGLTAKTVCAPLERVKILNQVGSSVGLVNSIASIGAHEGVRGFWVGNLTNCMRVFPSKGILFTSNDLIRNSLSQKLGDGSYTTDAWIRVASGALAGALAVIVTYPLDLAQTRMSGYILPNGRRAPNIWQVLTNGLKQEGFQSWYKGLSATLGGSLPFEGVKFGVYGMLQRYHREHTDKHAGPCVVVSLQKLADGACAGLVAQLVMFPNDTVRHRLQLQGMDGGPLLYTSVRDCYVKLFRQSGIRVFYQGLLPNLLRAMPNTAIQFVTYESCKDYLIRGFPTY